MSRSLVDTGSSAPSPRLRSPLRFFFESVESIGVSCFVIFTWPVSRRWLRNWGAQPEECSRIWPGDQFVAPEHETYTRAITIDAPADSVWQWVVQFGLGRAGFYSYELLERTAGIPVCNVESIVPALQDLQVGDTILLHPKAPGIPVASLEPSRHICFGEREGVAGRADASDPLRSWSIYMEPTGADSCRLLLRGCIEPLREPTWAKRISLALEAAVDFVMEQRMLRTVRRLAQAG